MDKKVFSIFVFVIMLLLVNTVSAGSFVTSNIPQTCFKEDNDAVANEWPTACVSLAAVQTENDVYETNAATLAGNIMGFKTMHDTAISGCNSISSVFVCSDSFAPVTVSNYNLTVSNDNGTTRKQLNTVGSLPPIVDSGMTCINATNKFAWTCSSFSSNDQATINSQLTKGAVGGSPFSLDIRMFNITFVDNPPTIIPFNVPSSPTTYKLPPLGYNFTATITDTGGVSSGVRLQFDGINYTVSKTGSVYNKFFTGLNISVHQFKWFANDTRNQYSTSSSSYTINKATPILNLTILPSSQVNFPTATTTTCTANSPQINISLTRNGVPVANPDFNTLSSGAYTYQCSVVSTQNYTSAVTSRQLQVTIPSSLIGGAGLAGAGGVIAITILVLAICGALFFIPFFVDKFVADPIMDGILNKCCYLIGTLLLLFGSSVVLEVVSQTGLDMTQSMSFFHILIFLCYIMLFYFVFSIVFDFIKYFNYKIHERRYGKSRRDEFDDEEDQF